MVRFVLLRLLLILHSSVSASPIEHGGHVPGQLGQLATRFGRLSLPVQSFLLGTLRERTQSLYLEALCNLSGEFEELGLEWARLTEQEQDDTLAEIMYDRMHRGEQLQPSQYMASALKKIVPGIVLRTTNAVLNAWRLQLPSKQAPACPELVARAVATLALCLGQPAVAAVVVLCFYGLLRVGEAISITAADIHFIGEQVIITLAVTKRGINEKVSIVHVFKKYFGIFN